MGRGLAEKGLFGLAEGQREGDEERLCPVQRAEPLSAKSLSLPVGSWLVAKFVSVSALQSVGSVWILSLTIIPIDLGSKKAY